MKSIKYFFKRKSFQIRNVFRWLPIIWKQYDWDYSYALEAFKFQLENLAKNLDSDKAYGLGSTHRAQQIRTAIRLMNKVYEEDYACEYQDKLKEKYGEDVLEFNFIPSDKEGYSFLKRNYEVDDKYANRRDEIAKDKDKWFRESNAKQERAHKLLWKYIEQNIRGWWD